MVTLVALNNLVAFFVVAVVPLLILDTIFMFVTVVTMFKLKDTSCGTQLPDLG